MMGTLHKKPSSYISAMSFHVSKSSVIYVILPYISQREIVLM
jgi:hypothetical protein